jgi:hypothetical protein
MYQQLNNNNQGDKAIHSSCRYDCRANVTCQPQLHACSTWHTLGLDAEVMMPLICTSWLTLLLLSSRMLLGPKGWLLYSSTCKGKAAKQAAISAHSMA